jgi:hypothetical protein
MNDIRGVQIDIGDLVAYPSRRQSTVELVLAIVMDLELGQSVFPHGRIQTQKLGRSAKHWVSNVSKVVVVDKFGRPEHEGESSK